MTKWGDLLQTQVTPPNRRGKGQGYFRYYRPDGTFKAIVAVNGRLIADGGDLTIEGLPDGFQTDHIIEAVQWKNILFIATGTELVEFDGTTAKVVEPYKPNPLEALYVGTNGLADFPDQYLEDGVGANLAVNGVIPDKRYGAVQQPTLFKAYITSEEGVDPATAYEYKWEYGLKAWSTNAGKESLLMGKDWSSNKEWEFKPSESGAWTIKLSARVKATPNNPTPGDPIEYSIPTYKVMETNENTEVDTDWVGTCNRIMLYWDRLIVYGDTVNKTQIYLSHLSNPRYFPVNNTLDFENPEQEAISKIVSYRDMLIIFMPSSIQGLFGKAPTGEDPFTRHVIHSSIGCIAPETAKVMGNTLVFLAREGVHVLKSFAFNESRMNVEHIDEAIKGLITPDTDACAIVFDGQYHLTYPDRKTRYRYYRDYGIWTSDESPYFDFVRMYDWQSELVVQSATSGEVYQFDETVFTDLDFRFEDRIVTKSYDMGVPYNPKKFKELHIITERGDADVELTLTVNVDDDAVIDPSEVVTEVTESRTVIVEPGYEKVAKWSDDSLSDGWNTIGKWSDEFVIYVPPVTKQTGREVVQKTIYKPNVFVDSGTVLGSWELGASSFSKAQSHKTAVPFAGKGRVVSVDIRNTQPSTSAILGLGFVFKLKKPGRM